ncbi:MAG: hypothetical protein WA418_20990, partial [Bradyrhizobium sp.]
AGCSEANAIDRAVDAPAKASISALRISIAKPFVRTPKLCGKTIDGWLPGCPQPSFYRECQSLATPNKGQKG